MSQSNHPNVQAKEPASRKSLLPTWIKVFVWIFMLLSFIVPVALVMGLLGMDVDLALYGVQSKQPISLKGLLLLIFFGLKGVVAFGLWREQDWAIDAAIIDAIIGIVVCLLMMLIVPLFSKSSGFTFRLELLLLIPYLWVMTNIKGAWNRS